METNRRKRIRNTKKPRKKEIEIARRNKGAGIK